VLQFRLELWSLLALLITLFVSLFVVEQAQNGTSQTISTVLSSIVLVIHVFVILGFFFFIGRGLMRRFMSRTWLKMRNFWRRITPRKSHKHAPKFYKIVAFFQTFADASEYDRDLLYSNLEKWWIGSPNYKRKRLVTVLGAISKGTNYENFQKETKNPLELNEDVEVELQESEVFSSQLEYEKN